MNKKARKEVKMFVEENIKKINKKLTLIFSILLPTLLVLVTFFHWLSWHVNISQIFVILTALSILIMTIVFITFSILLSKKGYLIFTTKKINDEKFNVKNIF